MKIIFVCTGNTCRSPIAESIAKSYCRSMRLCLEDYSLWIASRRLYMLHKF